MGTPADIPPSRRGQRIRQYGAEEHGVPSWQVAGGMQVLHGLQRHKRSSVAGSKPDDPGG